MMLLMYADCKKWPLEDVTIQLTHEKVRAQDCEACKDQPRKIDRIDRTLELKGDLSEEQRTRLLEIADRCPVDRTLTGEIQIQALLA